MCQQFKQCLFDRDSRNQMMQPCQLVQTVLVRSTSSSGRYQAPSISLWLDQLFNIRHSTVALMGAYIARDTGFDAAGVQSMVMRMRVTSN